MICVNDTLAGHPTVADDEELLLDLMDATAMETEQTRDGNDDGAVAEVVHN